MTRRRILHALVPLAGALLLAACGSAPPAPPSVAQPSATATPSPSPPPTPPPTPQLPIDTAVGQMVVAGFGGNVITPGLRHLIVDDKVGGVILFTANCGCTLDSLKALTPQLEQLGVEAGLPAPLMITLDQEGGDVARVTGGISPLPDADDLGREGPAAVSAAVARTAAGLASAGVALDLAPVADLRTNPDDTVIGNRSFGSDPAVVGPLVAAYVDGLHEGGVGSTLKHFPGLGGAPGDPHHAIATDPVSLGDWSRTSARSFAAGIAAGSDAVMTTAVYVPGLDPGGPPALLSRTVVTGLLRDRLGFSGVIVTDSLALGGLQAIAPMPTLIVRAAEAGNDLMLLSDSDTSLEDRSVAALQAAVASGAVSTEQVRASAARVIALRTRYGAAAQMRVRLGAQGSGPAPDAAATGLIGGAPALLLCAGARRRGARARV